MASHVLLAACRPDEAALEDPDAKDASGSLFTTALVEDWHCSSLHNTSYTKLFETLNLNNGIQNPQCEGVNKDQLLFSVTTLCDGKTMSKIFKKRNRPCISVGHRHWYRVLRQISCADARPQGKEGQNIRNHA